MNKWILALSLVAAQTSFAAPATTRVSILTCETADRLALVGSTLLQIAYLKSENGHFKTVAQIAHNTNEGFIAGPSYTVDVHSNGSKAESRDERNTQLYSDKNGNFSLELDFSTQPSESGRYHAVLTFEEKGMRKQEGVSCLLSR